MYWQRLILYKQFMGILTTEFLVMLVYNLLIFILYFLQYAKFRI